MYEYNICNQADEDIFDKQCSALEKNIPGLVKQKLIIDIDNSKIQNYTLNGNDIKVFNDYYLGAVYIKSQIDLEIFFN